MKITHSRLLLSGSVVPIIVSFIRVNGAKCAKLPMQSLWTAPEKATDMTDHESDLLLTIGFLSTLIGAILIVGSAFLMWWA
jgi:hypothetical protein